MGITIGIYGKGSLCAGCIKALLFVYCERSEDFSWWGGGEDVLGGERTSRREAGKVMGDRLESSIERQGNGVGVRALCCCDSGAAERVA